MRYSPDQKEKTRARILEAAGKVFRRQGFHAAGVDKVMEEAGLTAGGFYAHFDSKQALLAEAVTSAAAEATGKIEAGLEELSGKDWLEAFLTRYLSPQHVRVPGDGCPLVALISEVGRADDTVKKSFEKVVLAFANHLASHATSGDTVLAADRRWRPWRSASADSGWRVPLRMRGFPGASWKRAGRWGSCTVTYCALRLYASQGAVR